MNPMGCYASLGFSEGKGFQNQHHTYNLAPGGCDYVSTAVHEFLHILGASHEQTRPDRDDFVFINWTNIESGKEHNFFKTRSPTTPASVPICNSGPTSSGPDFFGCTTSSVTDTYGFDYDYQSVMHYSKTAFAVSNSVQTITPIPTASVTVGNNVGMSPLDISKLNAAYNCPNRSPSSSCDMSLIGTMGTLDQSTAMDGCEIFITVPVGHTIEFFFTDFNFPDCSKSIAIHDGEIPSEFNLIGEYCSTTCAHGLNDQLQ
ncbi:hatching enzyme 1.2-like [Tigriopus californicus]|uniref:hatching enzyme 1.2-like n=1 Tax=Tigriopus californicus TaxID=6832 RepID=UPI0027DA9332|nr:hatching enzyme 1.2-like [Tigriopus californicus]